MKTTVVTYHVCTSVLGAVYVQVPTPGRERVHRHHFLRPDFVDLEVKKPPTSGETEIIYARVGVDIGFVCS